jgi:uncharacterized membrane protein YccC
VDVVRDAFRTEERGIDWRSGLAGAFAAIGPLALGLAIGESAAGLTAALGGLNAALCVPRARLSARLWWCFLYVLGGAAALALAGAVSGSDAGLILLSFAWVGLLASFRSAGPTGPLFAFATSATLVIFAGLPVTAPVGHRLLWFVLGAVPGGTAMILGRAGATGSATAGGKTLRAVRDALLHDGALRGHALRLSVAVALGTLLYRLAELRHGYWIPLTTLAILQPGIRSTRVRSLQRAAGTLVAGALIVAVTFGTEARWLLVSLAAVCAFFLYAIQERGYFWFVVLLTPTVLLMLSSVDFEGDTVALDRVADSMIGIVIGLAFGELAREARA